MLSNSVNAFFILIFKTVNIAKMLKAMEAEKSNESKNSICIACGTHASKRHPDDRDRNEMRNGYVMAKVLMQKAMPV